MASTSSMGSNLHEAQRLNETIQRYVHSPQPNNTLTELKYTGERQQVFVCLTLRRRNKNNPFYFPSDVGKMYESEHSTGEQSDSICGFTRLCLQLFKKYLQFIATLWYQRSYITERWSGSVKVWSNTTNIFLKSNQIKSFQLMISFSKIIYYTIFGLDFKLNEKIKFVSTKKDKSKILKKNSLDLIRSIKHLPKPFEFLERKKCTQTFLFVHIFCLYFEKSKY